MTETPAQEAMQDPTSAVTVRQLLECGVHFGHRTERWNPKMGEYIFGARNGIHIIDLTQTEKLLARAADFVRSVVADGKPVLFVGTKKQAQEPIAEEAVRSEMPYVNHRWLGGMLTNFVTIRKRVGLLDHADIGAWLRPIVERAERAL